MKNFLLTITCVLLTVAFSYGQETSEQQANNLTKKLSRELLLSAKQTQELNKLLVASFEEAEIVRKNTALSKEVRKQKLNTIYTSRTNGMNTIFSDEQKTKYELLKKNHNTK